MGHPILSKVTHVAPQLLGKGGQPLLFIDGWTTVPLPAAMTLKPLPGETELLPMVLDPSVPVKKPANDPEKKND